MIFRYIGLIIRSATLIIGGIGAIDAAITKYNEIYAKKKVRAAKRHMSFLQEFIKIVSDFINPIIK